MVNYVSKIVPFAKFEATLPRKSIGTGMEDTKKEASKGKTKTPSPFLRFSGMAIQMLGTILIFTYCGYRLDEWKQNTIPIWTLFLSLGSIAASLYLLIRDISKIK